MPSLLDDPTQTINIDVSFFDETERQRLLNYPTASRLTEIVKTGVTVNLAQFFTYYLFHKKRPGKHGWRNYNEISNKIGRAVAELEDWVVINQNSLNSAPDVERQVLSITQRVGEAGALSVTGKIHDIHDADWDDIPEYRGRKAVPTFDYQRNMATASDGQFLVQVEAKGTAVPDTSKPSANINTQKSKIDEKKQKIRQYEIDRNYPHPADLRYGVICALGTLGPLKCLLTDPPNDIGFEQRRYRLLARLQFILDWISFLSGRSQIAASLATRLRALYAIQDPFELANIPLLRGNSKQYDFGARIYGSQPSLFAHLCRISDGQAVGTLIKFPDERLFFLGVQQHLFEKAALQDFDEILTYQDVGGSVNKILNCTIPRGRARRMGIDSLNQSNVETSAYITFIAKGLLHYTHGGVVFGIVTPEVASDS